MKGGEKKWVQYKRLIVDIRDDLDSIQKIAGHIKETTQILGNEKGSVRDNDLMACAGYLHHYYTCSNLFLSVYQEPLMEAQHLVVTTIGSCYAP